MSRLLLASALALGLSASAYAQSSNLSPAAEQAAFDYLRSQAPTMGLTGGDVAELAVSAGHQSALSGIHYVYVQQLYRGIPVVDGLVTVAVDSRGTVVHAAGALVPNVDSPTTRSAAGLSASQAVSTVAALVGAPRTPTSAVAQDGGVTRFGEVTGFDVTARQVYVTDGRVASLAWEVQVPTPDAQHVWVVRVDAATGAELSRYDLVVSDHWGHAVPAAPATRALAFVEAVPAPDLAAVAATPVDGSSYSVYPVPYESPIHSPTVPPADGRTVVVEPANQPTSSVAVASPFGWHDTNGVPGPESTRTVGNNVQAYQDRADDNTGSVTDSPDCGAGLDCIFPLDLTMDPSTYTAAAVTNLFYWNNIIHDVQYQYGFDEASGNFQVTNYISGFGLGGDDVRAEAQDGGGTNNANFATPADGARPRMQMYEWTTATPRIDGDYDAGIIIHEYAHGTSNRLTGGPATAGCLSNSEQMGEGWSDWYGLMLTQQVGDTGPLRRGIGTYALNEPTTGDGIRPAPYSTDFAENGFTYGNTTGGLSVPHGIGFVWSTILWEMTWELIDTYGYDPDLYNATGGAGNQIALALVTEGMKLQPCSPGFVDGRDAILAADDALYGGVHKELMWTAFARRGLGVSADQGSTGSNADNVEAFDTPITAGVLSVSPSSLSFSAASGGSDSGTVTISHNGVAGDGDGLFTASIVNQDQPPSASFGAGGPDGFGYAWIDSDEPGGPAVGFEDLSGSGTAITFTAASTFPPGDEGYADVALPFSFSFYGDAKSSVRVFSNGFLTFTSLTGNTFTNGGIPATSTPNDLIAPFWDDLDQSQGGTVYYGTLSDGRFAVQYDGVPRFSDAGSSLTFQVILAADGGIEFQYGTMTASTLSSASVGIENAGGTVGLPVAVNAPYVASNKAVLFYSPVLWASVAPPSGTIDEGDSEDLTVTVDATDLPDGTYTADLVIETNDPALSSTTIPITFVVGGTSSGTSILIDLPRGFRYLGPPSPGVTVDDLAAQNLVRGVPGYYAAASPPNLFTVYDAGAASWIPSTGTGEVLRLGHAFQWFMYNRAIGNPAISRGVELPFTLSTDLPPNTADVRVTLDSDGSRMNYLANPFGTDLDLTGIATWPGGANLDPFAPVWVYDPVAKSFVTAPATIPAWMGFRVRAKGPTVSGAPRGITIPASASLSAGSGTRASAARASDQEATPQLAFSLDATDGDGSRIGDRSLTFRFSNDARAAYDIEEDIEKFQVPAESYALIGARAGEAFLGYDVRPFAAAEIPLAIEARGTGSAFTLRWDARALPAGLPVVLVDLQTGVETDVRTQSSVTFDMSARAARDEIPTGDFADGDEATDRFVLRIGTVAAAEAAVTEVELSSIAPNPSAGSARVSFGIPEAGAVRVSVFDVRGRQVAVLADGPLAAGRHHATLDSGSLAAGVYVVRLEAAGTVVTRQAVVVR